MIVEDDEIEAGMPDGSADTTGDEQGDLTAGADQDGAADDTDAAGDEDLVVSIGDEPQPEEDAAKAPEWVRDLRKSNREKDRRIRELEQRVATAAPADQVVVVGVKPTLEGCNYDADKFETELVAFHQRKQDADSQQRSRTESDQRQQAQWQGRVDAVSKAAAGLKLPDYEDTIQNFEDLFPSMVHRGIIMGGPDDAKTSALLRYALGKNPKRAKELAAITDPVKFTFAIAKLEDKLKVAPRRSAPTPESVIRSSVAGSAAVDSTLRRLQEQADKSGDRTKVAAYMRTKARQAA